jgi:hypothetical protein
MSQPELLGVPKCDLRNALALVSCVKSKRAHPAPARDLYTSPLFTMARDLIESQAAKWRVLSALYGLVDPDAIIDPYDRTLKRMGIAERRAWANKVLTDLLPLAETFGRVVFFAGERYREFLTEPIERRGVSVEVPMEGLRQGEQLAWLSSRS